MILKNDLDKKPEHYCSNKELLSWLIRLNEIDNDPSPDNFNRERNELNEKIGKAIWTICSRFSLSHKFRNYTYRDEMIADAIFSCLRAIPNFDPSKSENPFSYFTMIASNSFIGRITKEKTQAYIKSKVVDNYFDYNEAFDQEGDEELQEKLLQLKMEYSNGNSDGFQYFRDKENLSKTNKEERKQQVSKKKQDKDVSDFF